MFGFGKKNKAKKASSQSVEAPEQQVPDVTPAPPAPQPATQEKPRLSWFARMKQGLGRTRTGLTDGLANLLLGKKAIDDELFEEIETLLLMADVGIEATQHIIKTLTAKVSRKELSDSDALYQALKLELQAILTPVEQPLTIADTQHPYVILVVGVNGVGKTTTIGKMARYFKEQGKSVMLAAGDTFRAAAVEQLQAWGERNDVPVIAQHTGADSASVIFDAVAAAKSRNIDVLIADTAGRLHNKDNLMSELEKVVRVMKKQDPDAPHETMLVLDAATGQNALSQAKIFGESVNVSGLCLTKLDGTAKGGIIFALAQQLQIPIRFIGVGESAEDLRPFEAKSFTDALFVSEDSPE
ncbi:signal recognition particle-docking protein FtsY [Gynuella sunshinyii]|uniref:Signal recognition particle receptor FtsY n=1 Tax=Gynuella sunshinyii YC6258 TaxID=1445510 RepID=A0A0C5VTC3_9GAMM|nr:signal recognition particle-docking protein FtsY [Gynuella sunshinyii]AJQ93564.1 signal recognition particle GTPase [Gynuella sunshinyii YC6258]